MDASFIPVEVVPSKTPFGLDQLRRSYKTALSAEDAIAAAPAVGDADEVFPAMFLMPISAPESAESATRVDLVYTGVITSSTQTSGLLIVGAIYIILDYEGLDDFISVGASANANGVIFTATDTTPFSWSDGSVLARFSVAPKNSSDNPVSTATTYTSSAIFPAVAAVPASVQYHAHSKSVVVFSHEAAANQECPDPDAITVDDLISWTLAAEQPASSLPDIAAWILAEGFVQRIIEVVNGDEIVPGHYWQVTKRKTMQLYPYAPPPP